VVVLTLNGQRYTTKLRVVQIPVWSSDVVVR
jgi:hypothetical protein